MKAPGFWWRPPGALAHLLRPISILYGAVAAQRLRAAGQHAAVPVICVGNVTLGGAGKTPAAICVAKLLRAKGLNPAFLTRGYGGRLHGPVQVDPSVHQFPEVGDEALLLARCGPTVVARDRPRGAQLAVALGADIVVMDDGLQNPSLRKDLTVSVFDGATGIGNGLTFPAGPLRAPIQAQWPLIGAVLIVGEGAPGDTIAADANSRGLRAFSGSLVADPRTAAELEGERVLAFAGIGRPDKFFDTLRCCGAQVVKTRSFADHHTFTRSEAQQLRAEAASAGLRLVTTEKDQVRLAALGREAPGLRDVSVLPVRLEVAEAEAFSAFLIERLTRPR